MIESVQDVENKGQQQKDGDIVMANIVSNVHSDGDKDMLSLMDTATKKMEI